MLFFGCAVLPSPPTERSSLATAARHRQKLHATSARSSAKSAVHPGWSAWEWNTHINPQTGKVESWIPRMDSFCSSSVIENSILEIKFYGYSTQTSPQSIQLQADHTKPCSEEMDIPSVPRGPSASFFEGSGPWSRGVETQTLLWTS